MVSLMYARVLSGSGSADDACAGVTASAKAAVTRRGRYAPSTSPQQTASPHAPIPPGAASASTHPDHGTPVADDNQSHSGHGILLGRDLPGDRSARTRCQSPRLPRRGILTHARARSRSHLPARQPTTSELQRSGLTTVKPERMRRPPLRSAAAETQRAPGDHAAGPPRHSQCHKHGS